MTKKKVSLASALSGAAKNNPIPAKQEVIQEQQIRQVHNKIESVPNGKTSLPPSRQGKKGVTGYFVPEVPRQLKAIAFERDTTVQELLNEALNDLFMKKGKSPII